MSSMVPGRNHIAPPSPFLAITQWARRDILMSQELKNCCETIFVFQLSRNCPHPEGNLESGKVLPCGRETLWEAFEGTIRAGVIASQKLSRASAATSFAASHLDVSQGPLGRHFSLRQESHTPPPLFFCFMHIHVGA